MEPRGDERHGDDECQAHERERIARIRGSVSQNHTAGEGERGDDGAEPQKVDHRPTGEGPEVVNDCGESGIHRWVSWRRVVSRNGGGGNDQ